MLKNHLRVALRNFRRRKGYTLINVTGLAVGMACCILIGLYVQDELSFDRFHKKLDRLVVIAYETDSEPNISVPYPLASTLENEIPEVERAVRTWGGGEALIIREDTEQSEDFRVLLSEGAFFEVFSFPFLKGNPEEVLDAPDGAVITARVATTFFGSESPIGKTLRIKRYEDEKTVTVRGVVENVSANSTIQFDILAPLQLLDARYRREDSWGASMYNTYALLRDNASPGVLSYKMANVFRRYYPNGEVPSFYPIALRSFYLSDAYNVSGFRGEVRYLYIFGSIALFILVIAGINYVNLVTAQITRRIREVGVRKVLGAVRSQLIRQFLSESVLISVAALVLAFLLVVLVLPGFNFLFDKELVLHPGANGKLLFGLTLFVLLVATGAGLYPALMLSGLQPERALRNSTRSGRNSGYRLRKGLVVFQFAVSVALITGTVVIYGQLSYLQDKDLGFEGEQVVMVELENQQIWRLREELSRRIRVHPGIHSVSVANAAPGRFWVRMGINANELGPGVRMTEDQFLYAPAIVDFDFVQTLGMRVLSGRDFSQRYPTDYKRALVINETAARQLGWTPEAAVGKVLRLGDADGEVIGVVEDFHIASLHSAIEPVVLQLREDDSWFSSGLLIAKLKPDVIRSAMRHIEQQYDRFAPGEVFEYEFLDETFDSMYRAEQRLSQVFTAFALLAVFVACLGLFGLASYAAETRTKEIGIRKVLGASVSGVVLLLSRDFLILVFVGFTIGAPLSYLVMRRWLEDFAYRIQVGPGIFILVGLLALGFALLTVGYQAVRVAISDPVKSLRYE